MQVGAHLLQPYSLVFHFLCLLLLIKDGMSSVMTDSGGALHCYCESTETALEETKSVERKLNILGLLSIISRETLLSLMCPYLVMTLASFLPVFLELVFQAGFDVNAFSPCLLINLLLFFKGKEKNQGCVYLKVICDRVWFWLLLFGLVEKELMNLPKEHKDSVKIQIFIKMHGCACKRWM